MGLAELLRDESAATMTEYAIILMLLSAASTAMLVLIAQSLNGSLNNVSSNVQTYELTEAP